MKAVTLLPLLLLVWCIVHTLALVESPRNLRVKPLKNSRLKVVWKPTKQDIMGYRVTVTPGSGGSPEHLNIPKTKSQTVLKNLQSGLEYTIQVVAYDSSGESEAVTTTTYMGEPSERGRKKEGEEKIVDRKKEEEDKYKDLFDGSNENLLVSHVTPSGFRLVWKPYSEEVSSYEVQYRQRGMRHPASTQDFTGDRTSVKFSGLQGGITYDVDVVPVLTSGLQATTFSGSIRTPLESQVPPPRDLVVTDVYSDGVKLIWKDPAVAVTAYRVSVFPEGQKDLMSEVLLDPPENMVELQYLSPSTTYEVRVHATYHVGDSEGVTGLFTTESTATPSPIYEYTDEFACVLLNKADIVLLVDGSWNVGRSNFNLLRQFLSELVEPFQIGLNDVLFGLVQYSRNPRTEWDIDTHLTKEDLLKAIAKLSIMGGIPKTGEALKHLLESTFVDGMGTRVGVPRAVVLITDGRSEDDVAGPAQALKEAGVIVFIIGMKNAERQLLEDISSKPMSTFMFHLDRFTELETITAIASQELCSELTEKAVIGVDQDLIPPSALKISDKTARSMWLSWNAPPGPVDGYLIVYAQLVGGFPLEIQVSRDQTSMFLENLEPNTEYHISVSASYPSGESKSVTGTEKTLPLLDAMSLRFQDVTSNTMEVVWPHLDGVTGYTIMYFSLGDVVDDLEKTVEPETTSFKLTGLSPSTIYTVTVFPLFGTEVGEPITGQQVTVALPRSSNLQFSEVTASSLRVAWDAAFPGVQRYLVRYQPEGKQELEEEVDAAGTMTVLHGLPAGSRIRVSVHPVYADSEGSAITGEVTTLQRTTPQALQFSDLTEESVHISWTHDDENVANYLVEYMPIEDPTQILELMLPGNKKSVALTSLESWTEYEVQVSSIYNDSSYSGGLIGTFITHLTEETDEVEPPLTLPDPVTERRRPRELTFQHETPTRFEVLWDSADGNVLQYRVTYMPIRRTMPEQTVTVPGHARAVVLQPLSADTSYKVTVTALYAEWEGSSLTGVGRTLTLDGPRNMRITDQWYNRFRVSWDSPDTTIMGFRVMYQPAVGGQAYETVVGNNINSVLVQNLKIGEDYIVQVSATYPSGSSAPLKTRTTTRDMEISDLIATNLDTTGFCVQWQMHRDASSYRVTLDALRGEQPKKEFRVTRGINTHCISDLLPGVEYKVSVQGLYRGAEGPMRSILQSTNYVIDPHLLSGPEPTLPPVIPGCYRAKADVVFLLDGSWSMGEENFKTVLQFVHSLVESFEIIGPSGVQVAMAQFSDVPRTEFLLKQYTERENLLDAIDSIDYMGGNTKTGRALKLVRSELLAPGSGTRIALPKAIIVITDGRSKDKVDRISEELQQSGHSVFAVGIDSADVTELAVIASRPVDNHVFFVGEFDELRKIAVRIADSICQVASATCPSVYLYGFTVSGFKMMEAFGLTDKTYSQHSGVSMVPGSMNVFTAYLLHPGSKLEQPTRDIHAEGLPDDFTISFLLRVRPDASHTPIAVWQILGSDNKPQVGVVLDGSKRMLEFFGLDDDNSLQTISFSGPGVEKIFFGSFHKVHVAVTSNQVTLFVDCGLIEKKACQPLGRIDVTGREVLGQHPGSNSLGGSAASLELQMLDIVCSADWGIRDKCCELPALRVEMSCPSLPHACSCAQDSKGPPGPAGPPGATGNKGPRGSVGLPGQQGSQGLRGETGPPGAFGNRGPRGPNGFSITGPPGPHGEKGKKGNAGPPGMMGPVGPQGAIGRQGTEGPRGKPGKDGSQGVVGPPGPVGPQGPAGTDGPGGKPGPRGPTGDPGNLGLKGDKGERGDAQGQRFVRDIARQVCEQLINAQVSRFNNILAQLPRLKVGQASAGPPGEPGREGPRGTRGETGGRGRPGFPGPPGLLGRKGEKGVGGERGEKGAPGVGSGGPPGIQGPQGATGTGRPGSPGEVGLPGPRGVDGPAGTPGRRGPPGPNGYCDPSHCNNYGGGYSPEGEPPAPAVPIPGYESYNPYAQPQPPNYGSRSYVSQTAEETYGEMEESEISSPGVMRISG